MEEALLEGIFDEDARQRELRALWQDARDAEPPPPPAAPASEPPAVVSWRKENGFGDVEEWELRGKSHTCSPSCVTREVASSVTVCVATGLYHLCRGRCNFAQATDEGFVCSLSGRTLDPSRVAESVLFE